jgi:hypothetical protein
MTIRKREMIKLRKLGLTYREIGLIYGVTRQSVEETIHYVNKHKRRKKSKSISRFFFGMDYTREKVRFRDKHTCQICGKQWNKGIRRFDVHHLDCDKTKTRHYDKVSEMDNMITLCHKCHLNLPQHKQSRIKGMIDSKYSKLSLST